MRREPGNKMLALTITSLVMANISGCAMNSDAAFDPVTMDLPSVDASYPPDFQELAIPSHDVLLSGFLLGANGRGPHPTVTLLHGYPGNEKNLDLAQSMRRAGFNVLFFHYRGAWGSQGDYALAQLADDVASVLSFLREHADEFRVDTKKLSIVGHSMGGFTALLAGARDAEVVCVVGIAAANPGEYTDRDEAGRLAFKTYTDQLFMLHNYDGEKALQELTAHAEDFDVRNYGPGLAGKSVMLVVGAQDTVVPHDVQERIAHAYAQVNGLKLTAHVMPGDHAFSVSRIQLQRVVLDWLRSNCR